MSAAEIDAYLETVPEPQRTTLTALRATLRSLLPTGEEGMAYGAPAFRVDGKAIAGFASFTGHCSYLPMSGNVVASLGDELAGYKTSKGAVQFPVAEPLPKPLVRKLVAARQAELA